MKTTLLLDVEGMGRNTPWSGIVVIHNCRCLHKIIRRCARASISSLCRRREIGTQLSQEFEKAESRSTILNLCNQENNHSHAISVHTECTEVSEDTRKTRNHKRIHMAEQKACTRCCNGLRFVPSKARIPRTADFLEPATIVNIRHR